MRIVVSGAGSVGRHLIERLANEQHDIVVVDINESILEDISADFDVRCLHGSASSLAVLKDAGVANADICIAVTESDETNLITCLLADSLSPSIRKIARIRELTADDGDLSETISGLFDHFTNPDLEAVKLVNRLVEIPGAVEVMEFCERRLLVVGMILEDDSTVNGCRLRDLPEQFMESDLLVAAINRAGQLIVPRGEDTLHSGDEVYLVVPADKVSSIYQLLGVEPDPVQSVMIYGCSLFSRGLAKILSARGIRVKLIERDQYLCEDVAEELTGVLVLRGDGTDIELLQSEGVAECDLFVGASEDQEENILASLLAKKLGAKRVAVVTTKSSYVKLIPELGVDIVVNPHIAAASSILRFVRSGAVSTIVSTRDDSAEVLEVEINEGSKISGKPLRDLNLPQGVIVVAKLENEILIIPKGETVLNAGEKAIFFASRSALPKLQKLLK